MASEEPQARLLLVDANLDRLLHHGFTLTVQGESYRHKQKRKAGPLGRQETHGDQPGEPGVGVGVVTGSEIPVA